MCNTSVSAVCVCVFQAPAAMRPTARPEEELERLTKKMLYDMDNPPTEEYFGKQCTATERPALEHT